MQNKGVCNKKEAFADAPNVGIIYIGQEWQPNHEVYDLANISELLWDHLDLAVKNGGLGLGALGFESGCP